MLEFRFATKEIIESFSRVLFLTIISRAADELLQLTPNILHWGSSHELRSGLLGHTKIHPELMIY